MFDHFVGLAPKGLTIFGRALNTRLSTAYDRKKWMFAYIKRTESDIMLTEVNSIQFRKLQQLNTLI